MWNGGTQSAPLQWQLLVTACPVMPCSEPSQLLKCRTGYSVFPDGCLEEHEQSLGSCDLCYISG